MIIERDIQSKIETDYIFLVGKVKIDSPYFMDTIEKNSGNSLTNVVGRMTLFSFFNNDINFIKTIFPILDKIDSYKNIPNYKLKDSWGLMEGLGDRTILHDHIPNFLSGVIYLNDHDQELYFPDIKQSIKPEEGRFVIFSSFLKHEAKRNNSDKIKYAISFNFAYNYSFKKEIE
jgi:hypothetical protein|tara:strand:- start:373 stop:894 length:522 start_codon:yes stop_codon:yes gene_type:complete